MNKKVVVIGHGYTSRLSIIRSVGMVGYDVDVVVVYYGGKVPREKPLDCYSKYVKKILYSPSGNKGALVKLLLDNYSDLTEKPVLIPESDFSVDVIDFNYNQLQQYFYIPNIDHQQGAVAQWMNKFKQKERAKSVGLNVASSVTVNIKNGFFTIPSDIHYPCFPKSISGGKTGLGRCVNEEMLRRSLSKMAAIKDGDVLIEEYLQIDKEYALVGFSDGVNVCIPAILYNEDMSKGAHYGVAKSGKVLPVSQFSDLVEKFKALIASIHFVGIFDIDFLECQGKFFFDEINLRFGGSGYAVTMAGVNIPAMFVDFMTTGNYSPTEVQTTTNLTFMNERICIDEWYAGNMTTNEFLMAIKDSDISFIKDKQDPKPYQQFEKYFAKQRRKRFFKHVVSRLKLK